jgi:hypothetical protein
MPFVPKTRPRWLSAGWLLPLVLLALPNCMLDSGAFPDAKWFQPGLEPASNAIMCDIPKPNTIGQGNGECATQDEVDSYLIDGFGFSLSEAATGLVTGKSAETSGEIVFDFSQAAKDSCDGLPRKIEFFGRFPDGLPICLNCGDQIPDTYGDTTKACIAKCKDLIEETSDGVVVDVAGYCIANTRTSTNYDKNICYDGLCTSGGNVDWAGGFVDPRRTPDKVNWTDFNFAEYNAADDTMFMNAASGDFIAGGASAQTVAKGDAWVEFEVTQGNAAYALSLRESVDNVGQPCFDTINCPDDDFGLNKIGFGLLLFTDGFVYEVTSSPTVTTMALNVPWAVGDRFRVRANDKGNGTATISYSKLTCMQGMACTENVFHTSSGVPKYPLRVDSSLREQNSGFKNVHFVHIRQ